MRAFPPAAYERRIFMKNEQTPLKDVIRILNLKPLTGEGGLWAQAHLSDEAVPAGQFKGRSTERPLYGTIFYLLTPDSFSCMHRLSTDEVWYHHSGPSAKLLLVHPDGRSETRLLGSELLHGELPQITVPRGTWQGCLMAEPEGGFEPGAYTLMSTSMAPAYRDTDFETADFDRLRDTVSDEELELLRVLTGEPGEH